MYVDSTSTINIHSIMFAPRLRVIISSLSLSFAAPTVLYSKTPNRNLQTTFKPIRTCPNNWMRRARSGRRAPFVVDFYGFFGIHFYTTLYIANTSHSNYENEDVWPDSLRAHFLTTLFKLCVIGESPSDAKQESRTIA